MAVQEAEREAAKLLRTSWWTDWEQTAPLPIAPDEVAERLGILVEYVPMPPDESGRIAIPTSGAPVISINQFDHPNRRRFTTAHEIGHYVSRRSSGSDRKRFVDYRSTLAGMGTDLEEVFANQFGAALLMPAHIVQTFVNDRLPAAVAAAQLGTSLQAYQLRLKNLRLA